MTVSDESRTARRSWTDTALTIGAVAGTVCIVLATVTLVFGVRPVIFETGSMAPAVPTGSVGLAQTVPATQVQPGDIVGVTRDDGVRVTHRVIAASEPTGNSVSLTLRGDANDVPDSSPYVVTEVIRVHGTVPVLGYLVSWLSNPYTLVLQALIGLGLLSVAFAPAQGWRRSKTGHRLVAGTAVVTVLALGATGVHGTGRAHAALTGSAYATGTVNAGRPNVPTSVTCVNVPGVLGLLLGYARVDIPNPPEGQNRYRYVLKINGQEYAAKGPSATNPVSIDVTVGLVRALLGTLFNGSFTATVYTRVNSWESVAGPSVTFNLKTFPLLTVECQKPGEQSARGLDTHSSSAPKPKRADPPVSGPSGTATPASPRPSPSTSIIARPELPPGGTVSSSDDHAYYQDGGAVTIRGTTSTEVTYRGSFAPASSVRWLPGTDELEVTEPDGTMTTVSLVGGRWTERVLPPPTSGEPDPGPAREPTANETTEAPSTTTPTRPAPVE